VSATVRNNLVQKRETLVAQLKAVDGRIEEVKQNRSTIEREIKKE